MEQVDREYFIGHRLDNFSGKDNIDRVTRFIDNKDWEWKAAELYCLVLEHHCASTERAHAAARKWRWASIGSWIVTIITICLSLGLSGKVNIGLVFIFGALAFLVLVAVLAVVYIRMPLT